MSGTNTIFGIEGQVVIDDDCSRMPLLWSKGISQFCDVAGPDWYWQDDTEAVQDEAFFRDHYGRPNGVVWIRLGTKARDGLPCDLDHFARAVLPRASAPFILVTTDGDATAPADLRPETVQALLSCPWLKLWYTQNHDGTESHKIRPIPIGLDLHTPASMRAPADLVRQIAALRSQRVPVTQQPLGVLCDFIPNSKDRKAAHRHLLRFPLLRCPHVIGLKSRISQQEIWRKYTEYPFVLSARGNGIDCHRTWEALYLGAIVITRSSSIDPVYESLPVVVVDSWRDVRSRENLRRWIDRFAGLTAAEPLWSRLHPQRYIEAMRDALKTS